MASSDFGKRSKLTSNSLPWSQVCFTEWMFRSYGQVPAGYFTNFWVGICCWDLILDLTPQIAPCPRVAIFSYIYWCFLCYQTEKQVNLFKFPDFLFLVWIPGFPSLDKNLQPIDQFSGKWCPIIDSNSLSPAVQTLDRAIHGINHYPVDKQYDKQLHYPMDRDLSTFWTTGAWFLEPILDLTAWTPYPL